jgi:hypothetical protein
MSTRSPLRERARAPTPDELDGIPWLAQLLPAEREMAVQALVVNDVSTGEYICRIGRSVTYWFGLICQPKVEMSPDWPK